MEHKKMALAYALLGMAVPCCASQELSALKYEYYAPMVLSKKEGAEDSGGTHTVRDSVSYKYVSKKEPRSYESECLTDGEKLQRAQAARPSRVLSPVLTYAVALSSKGTFVAGMQEGVTNYLVWSNEHSKIKTHCVERSARIFYVATWYENVFAVGCDGWIRYWNQKYNYVLDFILPRCVPSAVAVRDRGDFALCVTTPLATFGQQFCFFKHDGMRISLWPLIKDRAQTLMSGVVSLATHPTDYSFATGLGNGEVRLWDIEATSERQLFFPTHAMDIGTSPEKMTVLLQADNHIVGGSSRKNITCWDARTKHAVRRYEACHTSCLSSLCYVREFCYASGSVDGTVKLWDVRNKLKCVKTLKHGFPVKVLKRLDRDCLASCSENALVKYWDFGGNPIEWESKKRD